MNEEQKKFGPGTRVLVRSKKLRAEIVEGPDRNNRYQVAFGQMKLWVDGEDLEVISGKKKSSRRRPQLSDFTSSTTTVVAHVDLHGMSRDEALIALEIALDKALRTDAERLEILHGIGSGILKQAVHEYLTRSTHVSRHAIDGRNPGLTIAVLGN